jgi:TonB family protein
MTDLWVTLFLKATVVLAGAAIAAACLRRASAAARHLVWATALATLLILPAGSLLPADAMEAPIVVRAAAALTPARASNAAPAALPVAMIWLAGCLVLLLRLAASGMTVARLLRYAEPRDSRVRITPDASGPVACGFRGGLVLLPAVSVSWPEERLRAVVLHETAHLARRDTWALLVAEFACLLYWPNPLVWYAASRMRREQEHAADDAVLDQGIDAAEYAGHLVALARAVRRPLLVAGAVTQSDLPTRVEAILDPQRRRSMVTKRMVLASLATLLLISLPLAALQSQRKTYKPGEDGVTIPVVIYKVEPSYTADAKEAKIEGSVELSLIIESDGNPYDVKVVKSLEPGLDANAVAAVSTWRFKPAEKDGKPVPVTAKVMVNFRLL